jgi:hypothetical protein
MSNLRRRVDKLESRGSGCAECGGPPDKTMPVEFDVIWDIDGTLEDPGPTHCHACGRTLIHDVTWEDDPSIWQYPGSWRDAPRGEV